MKTFDPSLTAMLNDRVNDLLVEWSPDAESAYRKVATRPSPASSPSRVCCSTGGSRSSETPLCLEGDAPSATESQTGRWPCMTPPKPTPPTETFEIERLHPGRNGPASRSCSRHGRSANATKPPFPAARTRTCRAPSRNAARGAAALRGGAVAWRFAACRQRHSSGRRAPLCEKFTPTS
jgi:hypothetical protein